MPWKLVVILALVVLSAGATAVAWVLTNPILDEAIRRRHDAEERVEFQAAELKRQGKQIRVFRQQLTAAGIPPTELPNAEAPAEGKQNPEVPS